MGKPLARLIKQKKKKNREREGTQKSEMKEEILQPIPMKYKGSQKTIMGKYV